jgi:hypothetical protein
MRRSLSLLVLTAALGVTVVGSGTGAPPQVEADPKKDYPVFPEAGEWMVLAAYYTGPEAKSLAHQMVYKIRAELNLPAYVFVYVDPERKRQRDELDAANKMALELMRQSGAEPVQLRMKTIRVEEQYGVLIGGWADVDSANRAVLAIRKKEAPEVYSSVAGVVTRDTCWQEITDEKTGRKTAVRARINPFSRAIAIRNPSIPQERPGAPKVDSALRKFNEEEEYSLLNCPRPYTLLVKEYSGAESLQSGKTDAGGSFLAALGLGGNKPGEALAAAGQQAHELAKTLRQLNFEAYVLHSRTSSSVTIGGFDQERDPGMIRVAQQLAQLRQRMLDTMKSDPLQLYQSPMPMATPRQ